MAYEVVLKILKRKKLLFFFASFLLFLVIIFLNCLRINKIDLKRDDFKTLSPNLKSEPSLIYHKKIDFKVKRIYAVVFYGRKKQASILLRYLEPNIKQNGGILEKIVFAVKTNKTEDLEYLNLIMSQNKSYFEQRIFESTISFQSFHEVYKIFEDDDLVFKIDDDIVFIANGTFERMVEEYLTNNLIFLSANIVNHPLLSYVHARLRAIVPFYELNHYNWIKFENETELDETDALNANYDAFGKWWNSYKCAAIAHYSFFYNYEKNNLKVYDFNKWDYHSNGYSRWSINFVLMRGKYVNKMKEWIPEMIYDEVSISQDIPKLLKKHVYALGSAIVVHYSYLPQAHYLLNSNLLYRYEKLSENYLNIKN